MSTQQRITAANKEERQKTLAPLIEHFSRKENFQFILGTMVFDAQSVIDLLTEYSNTGEIKTEE